MNYVGLREVTVQWTKGRQSVYAIRVSVNTTDGALQSSVFPREHETGDLLNDLFVLFATGRWSRSFWQELSRSGWTRIGTSNEAVTPSKVPCVAER